MRGLFYQQQRQHTYTDVQTPEEPVASSPDQERPRRCLPSATNRSKVRSVSCCGTAGAVAERSLMTEA